MRRLLSSYHRFKRGRWIPLLLCWCLCQCVQNYVSPYKSPPTGYLVVEGYISLNGQTQYTLSRSIGLPGDSSIPAVTGAIVQVEGSDSSVNPLPEEGQGNYGGTTLSLNPALQYRLRIHTPNGETYLSDFVQTRVSPPIDSVNWVYNPSNGVTIYVNTHDPGNATRYYSWSFDQTWEYRTEEESFYEYDPATQMVIPRPDNQEVNRCWKDAASTSILIDNTAKLTQDVVYEYPVVTIPLISQQFSILFSIQITQHALTSDAYNFLSQMQINTESLGSVFDLQPTQLTGNIHCLNNPQEPVVGFISAGTVEQQRIFISYTQLPVVEQYITCENPDITVTNDPDSIKYYFGEAGFVPIGTTPSGAYIANRTYCIDCTTNGGTNQKPSYWPN
jgi:hypothetical protein